MAPGPMGQCFPVPDDDDIKPQMITTAENQQKIYRMYNFAYNTQVRTCRPNSLVSSAECVQSLSDSAYVLVRVTDVTSSDTVPVAVHLVCKSQVQPNGHVGLIPMDCSISARKLLL